MAPFGKFTIDKESKLNKKTIAPAPKAPRRARRPFDDAFKVKVVLEALKESMTLNELASKYEVHVNQIRQWKALFLENAGAAFGGNKDDRRELEELRNEKAALHQRIGEQSMDIDFLKKNLRKLNLL